MDESCAFSFPAMISASKSQESVVFFMYKVQNTRILSYFSIVFAIMVKSLRTARCQRLVMPLPCPP